MSRGTPEALSDQERADVRRVTNAVGDKEAARKLGIARATLASVLAELNVSRGTVALVRQGLPGALRALGGGQDGPPESEGEGALPRTGT
jgi:hypothetical protein